MFSHPSLPLLPFLVLVAYGQEDTKTNPVDIIQVEQLIVEGYNGPLTHDTMKLFSKVEDLYLSNSNFTPFNPSFLLALPNLRRLEIISSDMVRVDHNVTGCCENLEELEITSSDVKNLGEVELKMIRSMKSLKRLVLQNMELLILQEDTFNNPNISHLVIKGCRLKTIKNNAFTKLPKLEILDLQFNYLREIKKEVLVPLANVKFINLMGNFLEELKTDQFPPLPNLEKIKVSFNPIERFNLEGIKDVAPKLRSVDVTDTKINEVMPNGVKLINYSIGRKEKR